MEEVFLKIGHGDEYEAEKVDKAEKAATLRIQNDSTKQSISQQRLTDADLDEYSITDSHETNVFFLHFSAIIRKRILMQIRDQKILVVEVLFPVLMIILGMYLATIEILSSGGPLILNVPNIYPNP